MAGSSGFDRDIHSEVFQTPGEGISTGVSWKVEKGSVPPMA
jgi:hypothetical protein